MDAYLPTFLQQFQHLKIQLEEIISATNNFDDQNNRIGVGGFGKVYKGEVCHSKGRSMVAIKRLDTTHGQGIPEFLKEITMLSGYKHANLISLLGFCCEGPEMILVYEYASRGSLDRHLNSDNLKWIHRLKICIDAAKGLSHLHDPRETHQRLIHCDIKSANILLDDQWNAKVADFGLSIMGPANEQQSVIVTSAAGTPGYCDPQYAMTHTLTKESDIYSFGVVLFEVLCGSLCCTYSNGRVLQNLVPSWIESYKQKKLNEIIFKNSAIRPLNQSALEIFSDIAYRCLALSREDRPKIAEVVDELEATLGDIFESEMMDTSYRFNGELIPLLSKGILLNQGRTWFSLNKKGEHCEMISFASRVDFDDLSEYEQDSEYQIKYQREYKSEYDNSRFVGGTYCFSKRLIETCVRTKFLSPGITYTVNLVFKFLLPVDKSIKDNGYYREIRLNYGLEGEGYASSCSHLAYEREDGLWSCELSQFTSCGRYADIRILFEGFLGVAHEFLVAEGIEFLPLEDVECTDEKQSNISDLDSDENWEEKLPTDYEDLMAWSTSYPMKWTTKKEAYSILRNGFLIAGPKWFFLDKNGKKCHMLPAVRVFVRDDNDGWSVLPLPESRFGNVMSGDDFHGYKSSLVMHVEIVNPQLLSSQTKYATYLVYKLPYQSRCDTMPHKVCYDDKEESELNDPYWFIYLLSPKIKLISFEDVEDQNTHYLANSLKMKGLPRQRNDGWMEVQFWEFQTPTTTEPILVDIYARNDPTYPLKDLIV